MFMKFDLKTLFILFGVTAFVSVTSLIVGVVSLTRSSEPELDFRLNEGVLEYRLNEDDWQALEREFTPPADGVSITRIELNDDGDFIIFFSDGSSQTVDAPRTETLGVLEVRQDNECLTIVYTDETEECLSIEAALEGVEAISLNDENQLVVTYADGTIETLEITLIVPVTFSIDDDGFLIITYSDDTTEIVGSVAGQTGASARQVEFRATETFVQWRLVGDTLWQDLVALSTIKDADAREIELRSTSTHLQWRYVGETNWINLIGLSLITGPQGPQGEPGVQGPLGTPTVELRENNGVLEWRLDADSPWQTLFDLAGFASQTNVRSISEVGIISGDLVVTYTDSTQDNLGPLPNAPTENSIFISGTSININGELIITFSDGSTQNAGPIQPSFRVENDTLQWRLGQNDWQTLLDLNTIKGADGLSAFEQFQQLYPSYPGDEDQWFRDLASGNLFFDVLVQTRAVSDDRLDARSYEFVVTEVIQGETDRQVLNRLGFDMDGVGTPLENGQWIVADLNDQQIVTHHVWDFPTLTLNGISYSNLDEALSTLGYTLETFLYDDFLVFPGHSQELHPELGKLTHPYNIYLPLADGSSHFTALSIYDFKQLQTMSLVTDVALVLRDDIVFPNETDPQAQAMIGAVIVHQYGTEVRESLEDLISEGSITFVPLAQADQESLRDFRIYGNGRSILVTIRNSEWFVPFGPWGLISQAQRVEADDLTLTMDIEMAPQFGEILQVGLNETQAGISFAAIDYNIILGGLVGRATELYTDRAVVNLLTTFNPSFSETPAQRLNVVQGALAGEITMTVDVKDSFGSNDFFFYEFLQDPPNEDIELVYGGLIGQVYGSSGNMMIRIVNDQYPSYTHGNETLNPYIEKIAETLSPTFGFLAIYAIEPDVFFIDQGINGYFERYVELIDFFSGLEGFEFNNNVELGPLTLIPLYTILLDYDESFETFFERLDEVFTINDADENFLENNNFGEELIFLASIAYTLLNLNDEDINKLNKQFATLDYDVLDLLNSLLTVALFEARFDDYLTVLLNETESGIIAFIEDLLNDDFSDLDEALKALSDSEENQIIFNYFDVIDSARNTSFKVLDANLSEVIALLIANYFPDVTSIVNLFAYTPFVYAGGIIGEIECFGCDSLNITLQGVNTEWLPTPRYTANEWFMGGHIGRIFSNTTDSSLTITDGHFNTEQFFGSVVAGSVVEIQGIAQVLIENTTVNAQMYLESRNPVSAGSGFIFDIVGADTVTLRNLTFSGMILGVDGDFYTLEEWMFGFPVNIDFTTPPAITNSVIGGFLLDSVSIRNLNLENLYIGSESIFMGGQVGGVGGFSNEIETLSMNGLNLHLEMHAFAGAGVFVDLYNITTLNFEHNELHVSISESESASGGWFGTLENITSASFYNSNIHMTVSGVSSNMGGLIGEFKQVSNALFESISVVGTLESTGDTIGGLIGGVEDVDSLTLSGVQFNGTITGNALVGGLIGKVNATNHLTVQHATTTGILHASGDSVGGFIGFSNALNTQITNSTNQMQISSTADTVGGLIGELQNTRLLDMRYNKNEGAIHVEGSRWSIGGFVGSAFIETLIFEHNIQDGSITAQHSTRVGGFFGFAESASENNETTMVWTVSKNSMAGEIQAREYFGGLFGLIYGTVDDGFNGVSDWASTRFYNSIIFESNILDVSLTSATLGRNIGGLIGYLELGHEIIVSGNAVTVDITGLDRLGGYFGGMGYIASYHFENNTVDATINASNTAPAFVGGLIGEMFMVNAAEFDTVVVTGSIQSLGERVGGLIGGYTNGDKNSENLTLANIQFSGTITGQAVVGGLIGSISDTDQFSITSVTTSGIIYATGEDIGGMIGFSDAKETIITHSTNRINITAQNSFIGGFIGFQDAYNSLEMRHNTNAGDLLVSGSSFGGVGGFVGQALLFDLVFENNHQNSTITALNTIYVGGFFGLMTGQLDSTWHLSHNRVSGTLDALRDIGGVSGDVTVVGTLSMTHNTITLDLKGGVRAGGFIGVLDDINSFNFTDNEFQGVLETSTNHAGGWIGLMENITQAAFMNSNAHVTLSGVGNHSGGLMGEMLNVRNAEFNNISVDGTIESLGNGVGGFIGRYHNSENVTLSSVQFNGSITGQAFVGGLIGSVSNTSSLHLITSDIAGDIHSSGANTGGLIGFADVSNAVITDTTNRAHVIQTGANLESLGGFLGSIETNRLIFTNNQNFGLVRGLASQYVGGFIGKVSYLTGDITFDISQNFQAGSIAGDTFVGGLIGQFDKFVPASQSLQNLTLSNNIVNTETVQSNQGGLGGLIGDLRHVSQASVQGNLVNTQIINTSGSGVGGFFGYITNIHSFTALSNSYAGEIVATADEVGGFAGDIKSSDIYLRSFNLVADILVTGSHIGGAVGIVSQDSAFTLEDSAMLGEIIVHGSQNFVGGILGLAVLDGFMTKNVSFVITLEAPQSNHVGGFMGALNFSLNAHTPFVMETVSRVGDVEGQDRVGGFIGSVDRLIHNEHSYLIISNAAIVQNITGSNTVGGLIGSITNIAEVFITEAAISMTIKNVQSEFGGLIGSIASVTAVSIGTSSFAVNYEGNGSFIGGLIGSLSQVEAFEIHGVAVASTLQGASHVAGFIADINDVGIMTLSAINVNYGLTGTSVVAGLISKIDGANHIHLHDIQLSGTLYGDEKLAGFITTIERVTVAGFYQVTTDAIILQSPSSNVSPGNFEAISGFIYDASEVDSMTLNTISVAGQVNGSSLVSGILSKGDNITQLTLDSVTNNSRLISTLGAGGLIGTIENSSTTITNSMNSGNIESPLSGGLVYGSANSSLSITDSHNFGDIFARVDQILRLPDNAANPFENEAELALIGGIIGLFFDESNTHLFTLTNVTNQGNLSGPGAFVGGIGAFVSANKSTVNLTHVSNSGMIQGTHYVGGILGFIQSENLIMDTLYNEGHIQGASHVGGLIGKIDTFTGSLNIASNQGDVTASGDRVGGIIGFIDTDDSLAPFALSQIQQHANVSGFDVVGGLMGVARFFTLDTISVEGNITVSKSTSPQALFVGGLIGLSDSGSIKNIDVRSHLSVDGSGFIVGGLLGIGFDSDIEFTIFTGTMTTSNTQGLATQGAIVGEAFELVTLSSVLWDNEQLPALDSVGAGVAHETDTVGLSTSALQELTTYTSRNFDMVGVGSTDESIWIIALDSYPKLAAFIHD